jgi:hypothetical protein
MTEVLAPDIYIELTVRNLSMYCTICISVFMNYDNDITLHYIIILLTPHWGLFSDRLHQVPYIMLTYVIYLAYTAKNAQVVAS